MGIAGLTIRELADLLDPPVTADQVKHMVRAVGLRPCGHRRTGRKGRPTALYDATVILRVHAALVPFMNGSQVRLPGGEFLQDATDIRLSGPLVVVPVRDDPD